MEAETIITNYPFQTFYMTEKQRRKKRENINMLISQYNNNITNQIRNMINEINEQVGTHTLTPSTFYMTENQWNEALNLLMHKYAENNRSNVKELQRDIAKLIDSHEQNSVGERIPPRRQRRSHAGRRINKSRLK